MKTLLTHSQSLFCLSDSLHPAVRFTRHPAAVEAEDCRHVTPPDVTCCLRLVKMATAGTLHPPRISALLAVCLGLLSVLNAGSCDEQVPLILWTSEG